MRRPCRDVEALSSGLVILINGALNALGMLASPLTIAGALGVLSLVWLCLVEIDELDRMGTKPIIGRH